MKAGYLWMVILLVLPAGGAYAEAFEQPPLLPVEEEPEILLHGPMHEAFAAPADLLAQEGLVVPDPPPPDVVERPPSEKPAGRQFVWVPGYWAWDPPRQDYVWVSGCWRAAPPDRHWIPGYWSETERGWVWYSGFWSPVTRMEEIEYLPPPPPIEELQPPGPAPNPEQFWVPPSWYWRDGRYVWRPGYWLAGRSDWVWVPSHYIYTPRGYIFVTGHWDHTLARRGVLFAPVYFPRPVYVRPGFSLPLSVVVTPATFEFGLFTYPRYRHYFFGDYYDEINIRFGIFPRFDVVRIYTWYDPLFIHDRWRYRRINPGWESHLRRQYDRRRADPRLRPPRTYRETVVRQARVPESELRSVRIAEPLSRVVADRSGPLDFERIDADARQRLSSDAGGVHRLGRERRSWESGSPGFRESAPRSERRRSPELPSVAVDPSTPPRAAEIETRAPSATRVRPTPRSVEGREPVRPPADRLHRVTPSPSQRDVVGTPNLGERSPTAPSVERRPAAGLPRDVNRTSPGPERMSTPPPLGPDPRGTRSIHRPAPSASRPGDDRGHRDFRRGTPGSSRPSADRGTRSRDDPSRERR